jgi:hypothetical protein
MLRFFLEKNSILSGYIAGILIPFVGYAILLMIFEQLQNAGIITSEGEFTGFRYRTSLLVAICLNLLPMNYYRKKYFFQSQRGMVFATMTGVIIWLIIFGPALFSK